MLLLQVSTGWMLKMWVPALLKENHGAEEMAQQVKDQNADHQNPRKARGAWQQACIPVHERWRQDSKNKLASKTGQLESSGSK